MAAAAPQDTFRFGLLTDIQCADKEDTQFEGRTRHYRQVPDKLRAAVGELLRLHADGGRVDSHARAAAGAPAPAPASPGSDSDAANNAGAPAPPPALAGAAAGVGVVPPGLAALLHLGDMIDGYPGDPSDTARSLTDLNLVISELGRAEAAGVRVVHTLGNHDLAVPRAELAVALGLPAGRGGYHSARLAEGWRVVVLDTTEISVYGRGEGAPETAEARATLAALAAAGAPNATEWNSGAGAAQRAWLRAELAAAAAAGERVVAAAHHPLAEGSAPAHYLAWDHAELRAALEDTPGLVPLVLTGHFHAGGAVRSNGTSYVTLEGLVEAPPGSNAYAVVEVAPAAGTITVHGGGYATSRVLAI
ncbi:MAG: Metallo-dependent phosphatase-like protein [Monoraphidium minutum]|nr:MAG: Metallo-dependent phosphatase-like protein [Monoraphidium minutum]